MGKGLACSIFNVQFSAAKTKSLIIKNKKYVYLNPTVYLSKEKIEEVKSFKYLGLHIMSSLWWNMHIDSIVTKAMKRLYITHIRELVAVNWIIIYVSILMSLTKQNVCVGLRVRMHMITLLIFHYMKDIVLYLRMSFQPMLHLTFYIIFYRIKSILIEFNYSIFTTVHKYIKDTGRFL